jgi:hypothetical protein
MNGYFVWIVIITILIILGLLNLFKLRKKSLDSLYTVLYVNNDPELYQKLLCNRHQKLLFSNSTIKHFQLNGYIYSDDERKVKELADQLRSSNLAYGEKMEMEPALLSYWCKKGNNKEAKKALMEIDRLYAGRKKDQNLAIQEDAHLIYGVYAEKDKTLIPKLQASAEAQTGMQRAVTLFRMAKLSSSEDAKQYLQEALPSAHGTIYESIIQECLNDPDSLHKY